MQKSSFFFQALCALALIVFSSCNREDINQKRTDKIGGTYTIEKLHLERLDKTGKTIDSILMPTKDYRLGQIIFQSCKLTLKQGSCSGTFELRTPSGTYFQAPINYSVISIDNKDRLQVHSHGDEKTLLQWNSGTEIEYISEKEVLLRSPRGSLYTNIDGKSVDYKIKEMKLMKQ